MRNKRGFTLVELIISIVVIAIIMYAAIGIFVASGAKGVNVEVFTVAQSLAENKLEQAMAQDFGDVTDEAEANFSGDLNQYSYEIVMDYVSGEALDTPVGSPTDYKKIRVLIRHDLLGAPTSLESIRANY
ncbi:MAG: prepilin-type N-terminal cleavage/methylation domain-containing protein [Candidatus Margulisiibacteriota bacterium]